MISNAILFDSSNASIIYIKRREYMYVAIEGFLTSEKQDSFNRASMKGIKDLDVKKFLSDTSRVNVISRKDPEWITGSALPYLSRNDVCRVALIRPRAYSGTCPLQN